MADEHDGRWFRTYEERREYWNYGTSQGGQLRVPPRNSGGAQYGHYGNHTDSPTQRPHGDGGFHSMNDAHTSYYYPGDFSGNHFYGAQDASGHNYYYPPEAEANTSSNFDFDSIPGFNTFDQNGSGQPPPGSPLQTCMNCGLAFYQCRFLIFTA